MMPSNIPVRRAVRTRASTKNVENATAHVTRPTTRSKAVAVTDATASTSIQPTATTNKAKATASGNTTSIAASKTRRRALVEVTKLVTNHGTKGKEKDTAPISDKPKPKAVHARKVAGATTTTHATARRVTRSTLATTSTSKQPIAQQGQKAGVPVVGTKPTTKAEIAPQNLEKTRASVAFHVPSSTLRKRTSNLTEQSEPPRVFKRPHTEQIREDPPSQPPRDDSQEEVDNVAAHLMDEDMELEPALAENGWTDLDADDWEDPLMASEYVREICDYWKRVEFETLPEPDYFRHQPQITRQHREVLVEWFMDIQARFRLLPETLFLAVNIFDRLLSIRVVALQKLQLVGAACLLIACKYEETMSPSVSEVASLCYERYKPEDIVHAEHHVLKTIGWNLSFPGPMGWLRRGSKADDYEEKARTISKYFLEIGCLDRHLIATPPSLIAAGSLWLARLILGREEWTANLSHYTTYDEHEVIPVANHILNYVLQPTMSLKVYKKYASKRFLKCSVYLKEWVRQRWPEGVKVELEKHVEWLKADARTMREHVGADVNPAT